MSRHPNIKSICMEKPKRAKDDLRHFSQLPSPTPLKREPMPRAWIEAAKERRREQASRDHRPTTRQ